MKRARIRRTRGSTTLEWTMTVAVMVIPLVAALAYVAKDLGSYYAFVESTNGSPVP